VRVQWFDGIRERIKPDDGNGDFRPSRRFGRHWPPVAPSEAVCGEEVTSAFSSAFCENKSMEAYEYGYIHVTNGKVMGMRPATHPNLTAVVHAGLIEGVLEAVGSCGWERDSTEPIPSTGDVQIRIRRSILEEPKDTGDYRVASCPIDGNGPLQERIDRIQRHWEVNGWELLQVWERGGLNFGPRMYFKKPRSAPDVTPFVNPNAPQP
jgi:hypothetical protein